MPPPAEEDRPVTAQDPSLSPEANAELTAELRAVVGADHVTVPVGTPDRRHDEHAHHPFLADLASDRVLLVIGLLVVLGTGLVLALNLGSWWVVVVALAFVAASAFVVATTAIQLTTQVEHLDPSVAARLEEEGVVDADRIFNELLEDAAGVQEARGVPEVVSSGHNDRTADPQQQRLKATMEQRTALTPTSGASAPTDARRGVVPALPVLVVSGSLLVVVVAAVLEGGLLWLGAGLVALAAIGFALTQRRMVHADVDGPVARPTGAAAGRDGRHLAAVLVLVVAGVALVTLVGALTL